MNETFLNDMDLNKINNISNLKEQYKELRSKYESTKKSNLTLFNELYNLKKQNINLLHEF
jgi:predicted nuclease with TOPRIM domain